MGKRTTAQTAQGCDDPPGRLSPAAGRMGRALPTTNPFGAAAMVAVLAYLVLTAAVVLIGQVATSVGHSQWDAVGVNRWFASGRTPGLDDLTDIGSHLAATSTVVLAAVVIVTILSVRGRFAAAFTIAIALLIEVSVFLTTTLLVDRGRPGVERLDAAPPTSSFPSGHTAAAVVLYLGLAILVHRRSRGRVLRVALWVVLITVPVIVALSRLYRGMHHPTDVAAGVLLGVAALAAAGLAVQVAIELGEYRAATPDAGRAVPDVRSGTPMESVR